MAMWRSLAMEVSSDYCGLFGCLFDIGRKRLAPGPGMLGDIEEHALGAVEFLFEIAGVRFFLAAVDVILGAEALQLFRVFGDVLDQYAEMMDPAIVEALAELVG